MMRRHAIGKIDRAKHIVEQVMNDHVHGRQACDYAAREMGALAGDLPEADPRSALQSPLGYRVDTGIHICLAAIAAALNVSMTLMSDSAKQSSDDRERVLQSCASELQMAGEAILKAWSVLADELMPSRSQGV